MKKIFKDSDNEYDKYFKKDHRRKERISRSKILCEKKD